MGFKKQSDFGGGGTNVTFEIIKVLNYIFAVSLKVN